MLSFAFHLGPGSRATSTAQHDELRHEVQRRAFCLQSELQDLPGTYLEGSSDCSTGDARWMIAGHPNSVIVGDDWLLMRSALEVGAPTPEDRSSLQRLHTQLQGQAPDRVEALLRAQAQHDEAREVLWLAYSPQRACLIALRDPLGKIPLYFLQLREGLIVSNSRRALEPWTRSMAWDDDRDIVSLLVTGLPASRRSTGIQALSRLEPAHLLRIENGLAHQSRWWQWRLPSLKPQRIPAMAEAYRATLQQAVTSQRQLPKVVLELSGGIDSSSILYALHTQRPPSLEALTWTSPWDEEKSYATASAASLAIPHRCVELEASTDVDFPEPTTGGQLRFMLKHLRHGDGPVEVYTGHGGDSLCAIRAEDITRMQQQLPVRQWLHHTREHLRIHGKLPPTFLRQRLRPPNPAHFLRNHQFAWLRSPYKENAWKKLAATYQENSHGDDRSKLLEHPFWTNIFEVSDPGFHGESVLFRFPLITLGVIRFFATIPPIPYLYNKWLIRDALAQQLPRTVLQREKTVLRMHAASHKERLPTVALGAEARMVPHWINAETIRQFCESPEQFPIWTYAHLTRTLNIVAWHQHRLSNAPRTTRHDEAP